MTTPLILGGFNPLAVSGAVRLYWAGKDDDLVENAGTYYVAGAGDLSGNGDDISQADSNKRLIYNPSAINGRPAYQGDGTARFLSCTGCSISGVTAATVIEVVQFANTTGPMVSSCHFDSTAGARAFYSEVLNNRVYGAIDEAGFGSIAFSNTSPIIITHIYDASQETNNNKQSLYINGAKQTFSSTTIASSINLNEIYLGTQRGADWFLNGFTAFYMLFLKVLTDAGRQYLERGLGGWYGITMA